MTERNYCDVCADVVRLGTRVDAMEKAVSVASATLEKRLDGMDVDGKFLLRSEFGIAHDKVMDDIKTLNTFKDQQQGKASQAQVFVTALLAILSIALSAFAIFR